MATIAALLALATACGTDEATHAPGRRIVVTERYQGEVPRTVTVSATLVTESDGRRELQDPRVVPEPWAGGPVSKLESLLDDVTLEPTGSTWRWPEPVRSIPREVRPEFERLQLALVLLDAPADGGRLERSFVLFDEDVVAVGATRVVRDGTSIEVATLAVASTGGQPTVTMTLAEGETGSEPLRLRGKRTCTGRPDEVLSLEVREELSAPEDLLSQPPDGLGVHHIPVGPHDDSDDAAGLAGVRDPLGSYRLGDQLAGGRLVEPGGQEGLEVGDLEPELLDGLLTGCARPLVLTDGLRHLLDVRSDDLQHEGVIDGSFEAGRRLALLDPRADHADEVHGPAVARPHGGLHPLRQLAIQAHVSSSGGPPGSLTSPGRAQRIRHPRRWRSDVR